VEADLQIHCGIDFRDFFRGRLSLRRIAVMLRWLPETAATAHLSREGMPPWGATEQLLDDLRQMYLATHGVKNPGPHPMSPLAVAARRRAEQDAAELASRWEQSKAREAARQAWIRDQQGG